MTASDPLVRHGAELVAHRHRTVLAAAVTFVIVCAILRLARIADASNAATAPPVVVSHACDLVHTTREWLRTASQDSNALVALTHACHATASLQSARKILPEDDIERSCLVSVRQLEKQAARIRKSSTAELIGQCPSLRVDEDAHTELAFAASTAWS